MQQGAQVNTSINSVDTRRLRLNLAQLVRSPAFYPFVGLVVVTLVMILASDTFLTASNLSNIARQVSINAIIRARVAVKSAGAGLAMAGAGPEGWEDPEPPAAGRGERSTRTPKRGTAVFGGVPGALRGRDGRRERITEARGTIRRSG